MRRPRVRFREFLLLTILVSLLASAFTLRAKVGYQMSAMDHSRRADKARVDAKWLGEYIEWSKSQLNMQTTSADKTRWQASIKTHQADQAKKFTEAERHDRLAKQLTLYFEP
jgi:hypothetical protein